TAARIAAWRRSSACCRKGLGRRDRQTDARRWAIGRGLVAAQHPRDGVVFFSRRLCRHLETQPQKHQEKRYAPDSKQDSASVRVENAKFNPKSLRFVSPKRPSLGAHKPCREATRPLQEILMLLRPGFCRKVPWSGSPAVSPEIFVEAVSVAL